MNRYPNRWPKSFFRSISIWVLFPNNTTKPNPSPIWDHPLEHLVEGITRIWDNPDRKEKPRWGTWKHRVYDRYHVFMGLIFWVWGIGTHVFFFGIKLSMCFYEEEKKEKEWRRRKKKWLLEWVCEEERKKEKKKKAVEWVYEEERREKVRRRKKKVRTQLLFDRGSQKCVCIYKNTIIAQFP